MGTLSRLKKGDLDRPIMYTHERVYPIHEGLGCAYFASIQLRFEMCRHACLDYGGHFSL